MKTLNQEDIKQTRIKNTSNIKEITSYMKCHPQTLYKVEKNMIKNPYVRYFMFLRKKNVDVNQLLDILLK